MRTIFYNGRNSNRSFVPSYTKIVIAVVDEKKEKTANAIRLNINKIAAGCDQA
jgi:hypothetical protein